MKMNNFKSSLFDQDTFYNDFLKDVSKAKSLVLIESPFITEKRLALFINVFRKLIKHGVRVVVNTKPIEEHNPLLQDQVLKSIGLMQSVGVDVYMTVGHHRKLAVIDKSILWEGSLNIFSQHDSCEVMRRIASDELAVDMLGYIKFKKWSK
jgi:phosphatidylserine/phosphatidylglycerophosphate/cardiolipin synthase-like enzyme